MAGGSDSSAFVSGSNSSAIVSGTKRRLFESDESQ